MKSKNKTFQVGQEVFALYRSGQGWQLYKTSIVAKVPFFNRTNYVLKVNYSHRKAYDKLTPDQQELVRQNAVEPDNLYTTLEEAQAFVTKEYTNRITVLQSELASFLKQKV